MSSAISPKDLAGVVEFDRPLDSITHAPVYNVKSFGAVGDSTGAGNGNDDTDAIQQAIDAAAANNGEVYFPRPDNGDSRGYRVEGTLQMPEGVSFVGEGVGNRWTQQSGPTIFHDPPAPGTDLFAATFDPGSRFYRAVGRVHNLRCIGTDNSRYCFNLSRVRNCDYRQIYVQHFDVGLWIELAIHCTFRQMVVENCRETCVRMAYSSSASSTSTYWENGYFRLSPIAVEIQKVHNGHTFVACLVESCTKTGFKIGCHTRVTLVGCYCENIPHCTSEASNMTIPQGSLVVTDADAPFADVNVGDFLSVPNHPDKGLAATKDSRQESLNIEYGYYKIASVDSASQITLDAETGSPAVVGDVGTGGDLPAFAIIVPGDGCVIDVGDTVDPNFSDSAGADLNISGGYWQSCATMQATGIPIFKCDRVARLAVHGGYWLRASGLVSTTAETNYVVLSGVNLAEIAEVKFNVDPATNMQIIGQSNQGPTWWFIEPQTPLNINDGLLVDPDGNVTASPLTSDALTVTGTGVFNNLDVTGILQVDGSLIASADALLKGKVAIGDGATAQISDGSIDFTSSYLLIQPEGDTLGDDELTDINGGAVAGEILILRCWTTLSGATDGITIRHNAPGNLRLMSDAVLKDSHDTITLLYSGALWVEIARNVMDQQPAIADSEPADSLNELKGTVNTLLASLRTIGLIATS